MGICGSCGIVVNGKPMLACYTQVLHLDSDSMKIEPLPSLPVIKDLIVDIEPFLETYKKIKPILIKPEEKLKTFIANLTSTVERYHYLPSVMMQELASGGQHLPEVVVRDLALVVTMLMEILEEGVEKGAFIETNPIILHFMLAGTMVFYNKTKALRERYAGLNEKLADLDQQFPRSVAEELEKLIMRAIAR